jgi:hypothetical protein
LPGGAPLCRRQPLPVSHHRRSTLPRLSYTFTWKLGDPGSAATFTKTTLITGAAGSGTEISGTPNIMLQFAAAELDAVTADNYTWQLTATTSSLSRVYQGRITIRDVIT